MIDNITLTKFKTVFDIDIVNEFVVKYLDGDYKYERDHFEDDGLYYSFLEEGIELFFSESNNEYELKTIFIHIDNKDDDYELYSGMLPFGLDISNTKEDLVTLLGNPSKVNDAIPILGKSHSEIYQRDNYKIVIEYKENTNKLKTIAVEV